MNWITIVALSMIFIGGIGAIMLTIGQSVDSAKDKQDLIDLTKNENTELKSKLLELQRERSSLKGDLEIRDGRIQSQAEEIIKLNQQLIEKSDNFSNYMIGGKGFPILATKSLKARTPSEDEKTTFELINENDLPLYDVTVVVFDWNYIQSTLAPLSKNDNLILRQDDLTKSTIYRFDQTQMFENSSIITNEPFDMRNGLFYIKLKSRSSFVHEKMAFVSIGNHLYQGFIVYGQDGKVLKEWITPGAPEAAISAIKKKFDLIPDKVAFTLTL